MSKTSNAVKAQQLGMPIGTATGRLRKMLLFQFAQKYSEDTCYKCGVKIGRIEDFTIEHKKPWLHVSASLFWDLNNVAFSHLVCNVRGCSRLAEESRIKIKDPEGQHWCWRHKKFLPVDQFNKDKSSRSGLQDICKECQHYSRFSAAGETSETRGS